MLLRMKKITFYPRFFTCMALVKSCKLPDLQSACLQLRKLVASSEIIVPIHHLTLNTQKLLKISHDSALMKS